LSGGCSSLLKLIERTGSASFKAALAALQNIHQFDGLFIATRLGRLNSKGRVPTLVTPRGVLTETPAILQFICQSFPQSGLAPLDDPFELARMNAFNSYLCSTVHVAHAHGRRGSRWADDAAAIEQMKNKLPENMAACFDLIEREYLQGPWVLGENYSVSDMYLFTLAQWLEADGVDINRFPKVADHSLKMAQDPVVARVILAEQSAA
jgi:glutathione S-transferase